MACAVLAYMVAAHIDTAHTAMACVVRAHVVMAIGDRPGRAPPASV